MIFKAITNMLPFVHHSHGHGHGNGQHQAEKKSPRSEGSFHKLHVPFRIHRSKSRESAGSCSVPMNVSNVEISLVDSTVYGANYPVEDRILVHNDGKDTGFFGVFDGHGGSAAAEYTCNHMEGHFKKELKEGRKSSPKNETKCMFAKRVRAGLQTAFSRTEGSFKNSLLVDSAHQSSATVGTCALAAYVENGTLFVANAGDSRAIVGRRDFNSTMIPVAMSEDHNANQPREQRRLLYEHPDEVDLLEPHGKTLYLKGCVQTTRSIGDFYLKDAKINNILDEPVCLLSPPYVTCAAQVFTYDLGKSDEFLVMASDGLWDYMSNEEVVAAVHAYGHKPGCAEHLKDLVLERAAAENNFSSVKKLKNVPVGSERRKLHDDISVVVVYFGSSSPVNSP